MLMDMLWWLTVGFFQFVCLFLAVLGLRGCALAFSSRGEPTPRCGGFLCCRAQALGRASVVAARGFSSRGSAVVAPRLQSTRAVTVVCGLSCPACGIFSDQGSNHVPCTGRWTLNRWTTREAHRSISRSPLPSSQEANYMRVQKDLRLEKLCLPCSAAGLWLAETLTSGDRGHHFTNKQQRLWLRRF